MLKAIFACAENEGEVIKLERFIKKQKSRIMIEKLIDPSFNPEGVLALPKVREVRVPHVRD